MLLALASEHEQFWWITLGLGVVVMGAAIVLLFLLLVYVKDVDRAADEALEAANRVAGQTSSLSMLGRTAELAEALRDETAKHARLLEVARSG